MTELNKNNENYD